METVTAETITDEQIRELLRVSRDIKDRAWCVAAMRIPKGRTATAERARARARCAAAWNARQNEATR